MQGYSGSRCERCAPGYYGDPTETNGKCLPCQCNDNIDMNDYGSCDQRTGACLKCLNNTTGLDCGQCKYWHFGDPITLKNCRACECDQCGSESCDIVTGECKCKNKVEGPTCASCGENKWGFNQCNGCYDCECDPTGSMSGQCDARTGQCNCKLGVTGKKCDKCQPDHWNFTETGCQNCLCERAGVIVTDTGGFTCNSSTGYCSCIKGVKGKKCDECDDRWALVKHEGCRKCDTCVDTLLDDTDELFMKADSIENGHRNSSLTYKAHSKLVTLEAEFKRLKSGIPVDSYSNTPLANLQRSINHINTQVLPELMLATSFPIGDKITTIKNLLSEAGLLANDINELRAKIEVLDATIMNLDKKDEAAIYNLTDQQLIKYEALVDDIVKKNFNAKVDAYKKVLDDFENGKFLSSNHHLNKMKTLTNLGTLENGHSCENVNEALWSF